MQRSIALAAALTLAAPIAPAFAAQGTRYGFDAEIAHDTNATRGPGGADRQSDNILALEGSATRSVLLGPNSGAVFRGAARYARFTDFSDLSTLALVARAAWRYQRERSFGALWYELAGEAQLLSHADSDLRDGSVVSLAGSIGRYVTDRTRVSGGVSVERRSGDDTGLYDLNTHRLWGTFDLRLGARDALYGRLTRAAGDHVFNAGPGPNQALLSSVSERTISDPALGAGFIGYRIEATTWLFDLGYNLPLSGPHALDFSLTYYSSETDIGGFKYDGAVLRATYFHRFR